MVSLLLDAFINFGNSISVYEYPCYWYGFFSYFQSMEITNCCSEEYPLAMDLRVCNDEYYC